MKHYKTPTGAVYAFEADGSQDELVAPDMTAMTPEEVVEHRKPKPDPEGDRLREVRNLEAQITPLMLAEAVLGGNTAVLRSLVQRIADAKKPK